MLKLHNVLITVLVDDTEVPTLNASYTNTEGFDGVDDLIDYLVDRYDAPNDAIADWRAFLQDTDEGVMQGIYTQCEEEYDDNPFPTHVSSGEPNPYHAMWEEGDISADLLTRYYVEVELDDNDSPTLEELSDALDLWAVDEDPPDDDDDDDYDDDEYEDEDDDDDDDDDEDEDEDEYEDEDEDE